MRRLRSKQEDDAKIDITPMLDVVFIMLIFFIVTASFIKESGAKVNKPNITRLRAENPDGEVIVQADIESNAETVLKVVDALKDAGISIPTIATKSE
jgi:biopolymer transport protein ExbD